MKLKIDWKELVRRLWEAVKERLGGSLLTAAVVSGERRVRLGRDTCLPRARHALVSGETRRCLAREPVTPRLREGGVSPEGNAFLAAGAARVKFTDPDGEEITCPMQAADGRLVVSASVSAGCEAGDVYTLAVQVEDSAGTLVTLSHEYTVTEV